MRRVLIEFEVQLLPNELIVVFLESQVPKVVHHVNPWSEVVDSPVLGVDQFLKLLAWFAHLEFFRLIVCLWFAAPKNVDFFKLRGAHGWEHSCKF